MKVDFSMAHPYSLLLQMVVEKALLPLILTDKFAHFPLIYFFHHR
jgi:hypothetical protein